MAVSADTVKKLVALGAEVRWASCNIYSTQDHAAAAIAEQMIPVFAYKGEGLDEYWDFTHRIFEWSDGGTPNMILDDGGDATLLVLLGTKAEKDPSVIAKPTNEEETALYASIKRKLAVDPTFYSRIQANIQGVSEETTTGVKRLYQLQKDGHSVTVLERAQQTAEGASWGNAGMIAPVRPYNRVSGFTSLKNFASRNPNIDPILWNPVIAP